MRSGRESWFDWDVMVRSNKFTSPATWPLNLIFAVASFRLVERAIPTRDLWPFRCWKTSEFAEVIVDEIACFSHECCMFWSPTVPLLPTSHHNFWDVLMFWRWETWRPPVAFFVPSNVGGTCVLLGYWQTRWGNFLLIQWHGSGCFQNSIPTALGYDMNIVCILNVHLSKTNIINLLSH